MKKRGLFGAGMGRGVERAFLLLGPLVLWSLERGRTRMSALSRFRIGMVLWVVVFWAGAVRTPGQTAVLFPVRDLTGQDANWPITVTPLDGPMVYGSNIYYGPPITLYPTNGVAQTNLIGGNYRVTFQGYPRAVNIFVPFGVTNIVSAADPAIQRSGIVQIFNLTNAGPDIQVSNQVAALVGPIVTNVVAGAVSGLAPTNGPTLHGANLAGITDIGSGHLWAPDDYHLDLGLGDGLLSLWNNDPVDGVSLNVTGAVNGDRAVRAAAFILPDGTSLTNVPGTNVTGTVPQAQAVVAAVLTNRINAGSVIGQSPPPQVPVPVWQHPLRAGDAEITGNASYVFHDYYGNGLYEQMAGPVTFSQVRAGFFVTNNSGGGTATLRIFGRSTNGDFNTHSSPYIYSNTFPVSLFPVSSSGAGPVAPTTLDLGTTVKTSGPYLFVVLESAQQGLVGVNWWTNQSSAFDRHGWLLVRHADGSDNAITATYLGYYGATFELLGWPLNLTPVWQHPARPGDAEILGDAAESASSISAYGFYEQITNAVRFNALRAAVWSTGTNPVTLKLWQCASINNFVNHTNIYSAPALLTNTIPAVNFPASDAVSTFLLGSQVSIPAGYWCIVTFATGDGSAGDATLNVGYWNNNFTGDRHPFPYWLPADGRLWFSETNASTYWAATFELGNEPAGNDLFSWQIAISDAIAALQGGASSNLNASALVGVVPDKSLPVNLAGRDGLVSWGAKISKLQNGTNGALNIAWIGDSWSTWGYITAPLRAALQALAGNAGIGYWGLHYYAEKPAGVTYTLDSNWGFAGVTNTPGLTAATATNTSANLWLTSTVTAFDVCYVTCPGGGTFAAAVDGGAAITVPTAAASSGVGWTNVATGLSRASHYLNLHATALGTGGVTIGGVNCRIEGLPGIRLHDLGMSGSAAANWQAGSLLPGWTNGLAQLSPDLAVIMLGVNDKIESVAPGSITTNLASLISQCQVVNPSLSILLIAPSDTGITNPAYTSFQYRDAIKSFASANGLGFLDGCAALGNYQFATNLNLMANYAHPNQDGGLLLANLVYRYLQPASLELTPAAMSIGALNLAGGTNLPTTGIAATGTRDASHFFTGAGTLAVPVGQTNNAVLAPSGSITVSTSAPSAGVTLYTVGGGGGGATLAVSTNGTAILGAATNANFIPGGHVSITGAAIGSRADLTFGLDSDVPLLDAPTNVFTGWLQALGFLGTPGQASDLGLYDAAGNKTIDLNGTNGTGTFSNLVGKAAGLTNSAGYVVAGLNDATNAAAAATNGLNTTELQAKIGAGVYDASGAGTTAANNATNPLAAVAFTGSATSLGSGTLADARLSANVGLLSNGGSGWTNLNGENLSRNTLWTNTAIPHYTFTNASDGSWVGWIPNVGFVRSNAVTGAMSLISGTNGGIYAGSLTLPGAGNIRATNQIIADNGFVGSGLNLTNMQGSNIVGCIITNLYTNSGTFTWYMPTNCQYVHVVCIGPGGGGGSGGNTNSSTAIYGGGGGGGGGINFCDILAPLIGAPGSAVTITVGAGGSGGTGQAIQGTSGNNGSTGNSSSFGTWCKADYGGAGDKGTTAAGSGHTGPGADYFYGGAGGGSSSVSGAAGAGSAGSIGQGGGGGGGGGVSAVPTAYAGGGGGATRVPYYISGGTGGAINGGTVTGQTSRGPFIPAGGNGGSGSGAGTMAASVAGGDGAYPGGGGGGSGATQGAYATGNGGNGANGLVLIISYISL